MAPQDLHQLYNYLNKASSIAQQYPELDAIWGSIEDLIYQLNEQLQLMDRH
jgi:hypothetical protein